MIAPIRHVAALAFAIWAAAAAGGCCAAVAAVVEGGGSFDDAPLLQAGSHTDTILPQETLFYGVTLHPGQRLRVAARVDLSAGSKSNTHGIPDALGGFRLTLYSPLLERLPSSHAGDPQTGGDDLQSDAYTLLGPRVGSGAAAARRAVDEGADWTGPGTYYFAAVISTTYGDLGAVVEFPLRLEITIDGPRSAHGQVEPGPLGAAPAQRPTGARSGAGRAARASRDTNGVSGAVLAAGGVAGVLIGLLLGASVAALVARSGGSPTAWTGDGPAS